MITPPPLRPILSFTWGGGKTRCREAWKRAWHLKSSDSSPPCWGKKINSDMRIVPQELNYIKEKRILVKFHPNKKKKKEIKWSELFKALFDIEKTWLECVNQKCAARGSLSCGEARRKESGDYPKTKSCSRVTRHDAAMSLNNTAQCPDKTLHWLLSGYKRR